MKRSDPNRQLEFLLAEVVRLQFRVYNGRFRATGLNQSQVAALIHLDRVEELSQTDLAARLGMRTGLVERTRGREDRRLQLVSITDDGQRVVNQVDEMGETLGTGLRQGISREERTQLVSILQRLRENLRRMEKGDAR